MAVPASVNCVSHWFIGEFTLALATGSGIKVKVIVPVFKVPQGVTGKKIKEWKD